MSGEFLFAVHYNLRFYVYRTPYNGGSASGSTATIIWDTSPRDLKEANPFVNVVPLETVYRC